MQTKNEKRLSAIERIQSTIARNEQRVAELHRLIAVTDNTSESVDILKSYDTSVNETRKRLIGVFTRKNQQHAIVIENTKNNIALGVR